MWAALQPLDRAARARASKAPRPTGTPAGLASDLLGGSVAAPSRPVGGRGARPSGRGWRRLGSPGSGLVVTSAASRERAAVEGSVGRLAIRDQSLGRPSLGPGRASPRGGLGRCRRTAAESRVCSPAGKGAPFQSHLLAVLNLVSIAQWHPTEKKPQLLLNRLDSEGSDTLMKTHASMQNPGSCPVTQKM